MDKIEATLVSAKEMQKNKNNPNTMSLDHKEMSIDAIPDLDKLTGYILEILQYLEDPQNQTYIKNNEGPVRMLLNNKYADTVPYGIITLLLDKQNRYENVDRLMRMFEQMNRAKNGHIDLQEVEKNFTEEINDRYIYSKFGSKEEFEKQLQKEMQKNNE